MIKSKCKVGECDQLSLYEAEQEIEKADIFESDKRNLLIAYDQIIEFLEKGNKFHWSSTTLRYEG